MLPPRLRQALAIKQAPDFNALLSLEDAKKFMKVDFADDDDLISDLIAVANERLDGAAGILGRALMTQQWELRLDNFGPLYPPHFFVPNNILATGSVGSTRARITLPLPPLQTLDNVKYVDVTGALQTVDPATYQVVFDGQRPAFVEPAYGQSWPAHQLVSDAVRFTFTAGYGATFDKVPQTIRHAMKFLVRHFYDNRDYIVVGGGAVNQVPDTVAALLGSYNVNWF